MAAMDDGGDREIDFCDAPNSMKNHRACLRCGLVKCFDQFYQDGCENCPFLELADRQDRVGSCTTSDFGGIVAMMKPDESWLARWEGISKSLPGVYAKEMTGAMPDQIRQFLHDKRIPCRAVAPPPTDA
jgi:transcription elongation factor SPT4